MIVYQLKINGLVLLERFFFAGNGYTLSYTNRHLNSLKNISAALLNSSGPTLISELMLPSHILWGTGRR